MTRAFTVRRLTRVDLAAYKALRDASLQAHPEAFSSDAATERERPAESYLARLGLGDDAGASERASGDFTLGAFRADGLVGVVTCTRDGRLKARHIGQLVGMMVQPDARGSGVGRALLDACIAEARAADGLSMLTLSVTAGNAAAISLYAHAGFVCYGTLPRAIRVGDAFHAKDLMALTLS